MLNVIPRAPREEPSPAARAESLLGVPPTATEAGHAITRSFALPFGAEGGYERFVTREQYNPESVVGRGLASIYRSLGWGLRTEFPLESPVREAAELNKLLPPPRGHEPFFTEAIPESLARETHRQKLDEIYRKGVIARYEGDRSWLTTTAFNLLLYPADPLQAATIFIPGFGQAKTAQLLGRVFGRRAATLGGYAVGGATAGAMAESVVAASLAGLSTQDVDSLSLGEVLQRTFYGALFNAAFDVGIGAAVGGVRAAAPVVRDAARDMAGIPPATPPAARPPPPGRPPVGGPTPAPPPARRVLEDIDEGAAIPPLGGEPRVEPTVAPRAGEVVSEAAPAARPGEVSPTELPLKPGEAAATFTPKAVVRPAAAMPEVEAAPMVTQAPAAEALAGTATRAEPTAGATEPGEAAPSPLAEGAEARAVAATALPEWLSEGIERDWQMANRLGVVEDIERMAAQRMTAAQTARALGTRLDEVDRLAATNNESVFAVRNREQLVRVVRNKLGIPSMDETSAFDAWAASRLSSAEAMPPMSATQRHAAGVAATAQILSDQPVHVAGPAPSAVPADLVPTIEALNHAPSERPDPNLEAVSGIAKAAEAESASRPAGVGGEAGGEGAIVAGPGKQIAYHGSPTGFEGFSSDFHGTGEGMRVGGWGLHLTDDIHDASSYMVRNSFRRDLEDPGFLYTVEIPADNSLLLFDKPLMEQGAPVKKAILRLEEIIPTFEVRWDGTGRNLYQDIKNAIDNLRRMDTTKDFISRWEGKQADEVASRLLAEAGIVGHKAAFPQAEGNEFVIYDAGAIEIRERFGAEGDTVWRPPSRPAKPLPTAKEDVTRQLLALGQDSVVTEQAADLIDAFFTTMAGRVGRDARELYAESGLTFEKVVTADGDYFQPAFHTSPHIFDQFTTDFMGSGEGSAAFGWGLYFSQLKGIYEHLRRHAPKQLLLGGIDIIGPAEGLSQDATRFIRNAATYFKDRKTGPIEIDRGQLIARLDDLQVRYENDPNWHAARKFAEGLPEKVTLEERAGGRTYEVDIPEDKELLLWDRPLADQPEEIRAALERAAAAVPGFELPEPKDAPFIEGLDLISIGVYGPIVIDRLVELHLPQGVAEVTLGRNELVPLVYDTSLRLSNNAMAVLMTAARQPGTFTLRRADLKGEEFYWSLVTHIGGRQEDPRIKALWNEVTGKGSITGNVAREIELYEQLRVLNSQINDLIIRKGVMGTDPELIHQIATLEVSRTNLKDQIASLGPKVEVDGAELASRLLLREGIVGHKFLDAGSRTSPTRAAVMGGKLNLSSRRAVSAAAAARAAVGEDISPAAMARVMWEQGREDIATVLETDPTITISMEPEDPTFNFVIFDGKRVRITRYEQPGARGAISFRDGKTLISLFEQADPSTIVHESAHMFLNIFLEMSKKYPNELGSDLAIMQKQFEFEGHSPSVASHELFAGSFETYLKTGKAPSEGLRSVFRLFKKWLTEVYARLKAKLPFINPEVRKLFDRLLAPARDPFGIPFVKKASGYGTAAEAGALPSAAPPALDVNITSPGYTPVAKTSTGRPSYGRREKGDAKLAKEPLPTIQIKLGFKPDPVGAATFGNALVEAFDKVNSTGPGTLNKVAKELGYTSLPQRQEFAFQLWNLANVMDVVDRLGIEINPVSRRSGLGDEFNVLTPEGNLREWSGMNVRPPREPVAKPVVEEAAPTIVDEPLGAPAEELVPGIPVNPLSSFTFRTRNGTQYQVIDGKTYREGPDRRGLTIADQTIYVSEADAKALRPLKLAKGTKSQLVQRPDGTWGLKHLLGEEPRETDGTFAEGLSINAKDEPAEGLVPIGLTDEGKFAAIGSPIVEMMPPLKADPELAALEAAVADLGLSEGEMAEMMKGIEDYATKQRTVPAAYAQAKQCLIDGGFI